MLRFAQHDKTEDVIPSVSEESTYGCFASLSMTNWWMLRFIQHDKGGVVPHALFCHSERQRGIHSWMLHFAQHDKLVDASLRSA